MSTGDSAVVSHSRLQAVPGADSPELHSESIEGGCVGGVKRVSVLLQD